MSVGNAYALTRDDLKKTLFSSNDEVRARFNEHFPEGIANFLDEADRAYSRLREFTKAVKADKRAAWAEFFLFSAFNSVMTSCHFLISGFMAPSGQLMRHYGEATAMALLCSHHSIDVLQRIEQDPKKVSVDAAVGMVKKRRNAELLGINPEGWAVFQKITKWYDKLSHATVFSLQTQRMFDQPGIFILGGEFDPGKLDEYKKELGLRISAMHLLAELVGAIEENVREAQSKGLVN